MGLDLPPSHKQESHQFLSMAAFNPGYWKQDIFIIPTEILLDTAINKYFTLRSKPLQPFDSGKNNLSEKSTTIPNNVYTLSTLGLISTGVIGYLKLSNTDYSMYSEISGWLHAQLLTNIATSIAKTTFQRERPYYETKLQRAGYQAMGPNDQFSFFSGHAAQIFSFSTYSSLMMYKYSPSKVVAWSYTGLALALASYVSYTRVSDHQHYWGDIITGAAVGSAIAAAVFYRVQTVEEQIKYQEMHVDNKQKEFSWSLIPNTGITPSGNQWLGINFEAKF